MWLRQTNRDNFFRREAILTAVYVSVTLVLVGCEQSPTKLIGVSSPLPSTALEQTPHSIPSFIKHSEENSSFEIFSTLAGKMARMEELINSIDRFLGDPDFKDRSLSNAMEFHQLLKQSSGLYPKGLPSHERSGFDEAIEQTAAVSKKLQKSLQENDIESASEFLIQLKKYRVDSHTRFSH